MAQQKNSTLKSYFQTGDRPTQTQFAELIDSFLNKEDMNVTVDPLNKNIGIGLGKDAMGQNILPNLANKLEINGKLQATGLTIPTGAQANYVLTADASGNATWRDPLQVSNDGDWAMGTGTIFNLSENIGIGLNNPASKLEVLGDIQVSSGDIKISGQKSLLFSSYGGGLNMTDATWIKTTGGKSFFHETGILRTDGELQVGNLGARLLVDTNGDVGIGRTSPEAKLDVNGKAKVTTFQLTNGASEGYTLTSNATGDAAWTKRTYEIGDYIVVANYGGEAIGGYVFYLDRTREHGLICAVWGDEFFGFPLSWSTGSNQFFGARYSGLFAGEINSNLILSKHGAGSFAAGIRSPYSTLVIVGGPFSMGRDEGAWYLPSLRELGVIKDVLHKNGLGNFQNILYWSSTERNEFEAWAVDFSAALGNGVDNKPKSDSYPIIIVRRF